MARTIAMRKRVPDDLTLPEASLVVSDSPSISSFLKNIEPFFRQAGELEQASRDALDASRLVPAPVTEEDDETIQVQIKANTAGKKEIEAHWSVTTLFSGFHKRLTAARGRATGNYEAANERLQRLHNDFADAARRKAAAEQERIRRENEEQARQERERELRRLEEEAVTLEEGAEELSDRELTFAKLVSEGWSDVSAAQKAGYRDPKTMGPRLMQREKVAATITRYQEAKRVREQATAVQQAPLQVRTETVTPSLRRAAGASDRSYHYADILDAKAFVEAALTGEHGIPAEALMPNQTWLNEQAKALQQQIERWPGIRYRKTTKTV